MATSSSSTRSISGVRTVDRIDVPGREPIHVYDFEPATGSFLDDVIEGLGQPTKRLPSKYFYDERGMDLFKKITELPAYYLTRAEVGILRRQASELGRRVGSEALVIEYGTGDSIKAETLLANLDEPAGYVPVDIVRPPLVEAARHIAEAHPTLPVYAVCADYMNRFELPDLSARRRLIYFPGSTIGNLRPKDAESFLAMLGRQAGNDGLLLIGADLQKDRATLEAAYNDPEGVTAAFNKNVLVRINRELGGDVDLEAFDHRAVYNQVLGRIEMHLVSRVRQDVQIGERTFTFQEGETIHTENSYKYTLEDFDELARRAGLEVVHVWMDPEELFSLQLLATR